MVSFFKKHSGIIENIFSLSLLRVLEQVMPLITFPYIVSKVGAEKYGVIATAQALALFFVVFVNFGFNVSCVRDVALSKGERLRLNKIVGSVYLCKFLFVLISLAVFILTLFASRRFDAERMVFLGAFLMVFNAWILPVWFFQGIEKMKFISLMSIVRHAFYLGFIFSFVKNSTDYWKVTYIQSICGVLGGVVGFLVVLFRYRIRPSFCLVEARKLFFQGTPIFLNLIGAITVQKLPVILISRYCGFEGAGLFAVANRIMDVGRAMTNILVQVFYPKFSKLYGEDEYRYYREWLRVSIILVVVGSIMWLGLSVLAPFVFDFMNMDSVLRAVPIIRLYGSNLILGALTSSFGILSLLVVGRGDLLAWSQLIPVILSICLGVPVVKFYGFVPYVCSVLFVNLLSVFARFLMIVKVGFFKRRI
jgi:PST family polysaccharide transporter